MWKELMDLALPRECLVCGKPLGAREEHLCLHCASDLPLSYYWERTHNPMADEFNALLEKERETGAALPYVYAAALLFYHHENPYRRIPQALKYGGNLSAGRAFAARLGAYMACQPHWADVDTVLPVPLHRFRQWQRGYNQAAVIAGELARALQARLEDGALLRVRRTRSQTLLSADARLQNVAGVFSLRRQLSSRHLLLVDDTFTTGATLAACYKTVREALGEAPRISIAALSVVQD